LNLPPSLDREEDFLASVERTAYPRFSSAITAAELQHSFTPTEIEQGLAQSYTRTDQHALCFVILLKSLQRLRYFPALEQVPAAIIAHVRTCLQVGPEVEPAYETGRTLYRHHVAIREYLRSPGLHSRGCWWGGESRQSNEEQ